MKIIAAAAALLATTALLGACSFSAKTGHNYASVDGVEYTYGAAPDPVVKVHYAGLIDGRDTVLWISDGAMAQFSCDKPCTNTRLTSLDTGKSEADYPFVSPTGGNGKIRDLVFDDIAYKKLTLDASAADVIAKAKAKIAATPTAPAE